MNSNHQKAIDAIQKKLIGKRLSYEEIFAIMDEIAHERLGMVLTTYFAAAGVTEGFTHEELYSLTRAMVETGPRLHFSGIVADKHSTGGVAGTRTTMILVPIIAEAGFLIPKNSTRAITSPAGTADTMEVIAPVTFNLHQIEKIVKNVGGCIVWGGPLGLAPADDVLIRVEEPLAFESFDKFIVSIMAKNIATGATHLVLDIPVGPTMKIQHYKDGEIIAKKFSYLARKFNIHAVIDLNETLENAGRGAGPALEARDVLMVLEQNPERPLALEAKALRLAGKLLDICFRDTQHKKHLSGEMTAREILKSGRALTKMREIVKAQGGNPDISSSCIKTGKFKKEIQSTIKGRVHTINNHHITIIGRILGCPEDKKAGIYLNTKLDVPVLKHDILCTLYSSDAWKLKEALETIKNFPIYFIR